MSENVPKCPPRIALSVFSVLSLFRMTILMAKTAMIRSSKKISVTNRAVHRPVLVPLTVPITIIVMSVIRKATEVSI